MSSMMTAAAKDQRTVKAILQGQGRQKTVYSFLPNPSGPGTGRAASWMRRHHPLARVVSDHSAELADGRTLWLAGCTVADLYTEPPALGQTPPAVGKQLPFRDPEPEPLPGKTALRRMKPAALRALCEGRGLAAFSNMSKAKMIELLCK